MDNSSETSFRLSTENFRSVSGEHLPAAVQLTEDLQLTVAMIDGHSRRLYLTAMVTVGKGNALQVSN